MIARRLSHTRCAVETQLSTDMQTLVLAIYFPLFFFQFVFVLQFDNLAALARVCAFDRIFVSTRDPAIVQLMKDAQRRRQQQDGADNALIFVWDNEELRYDAVDRVVAPRC